MTSPGEGTLTFGIYAGSALGEDAGAIVPGPPDVPGCISSALDELQGPPGHPFLVRAYCAFTDAGATTGPVPAATPADFTRYLQRGRRLDLVAQFHSASGDVDGYCGFLEDLIDRYGEGIATLQVAEEPNITDNHLLDGWYPRVIEAIARGVPAARAKALRCGLPSLRVGCNTTLLLGDSQGFYARLAEAGGEHFRASLDYAGLDIFPDVFRPVPPGRLRATMAAVLAGHRHDALAAAVLGHIPLVITEHGWPTGVGRPPARQAEVVADVVDVVAGHAGALNITGYTHHALRDASSADPGLFSQFGILADDYAPKPAFGTYRDLIAALG